MTNTNCAFAKYRCIENKKKDKKKSKNKNKTTELEPLGVLGDLGSHVVRLVLWAFDYEPPRYVKAVCTRRNHAGAFQDVSAWLFFTNDRMAAVDVSYHSPLRQHV